MVGKKSCTWECTSPDKKETVPRCSCSRDSGHESSWIFGRQCSQGKASVILGATGSFPKVGAGTSPRSLAWKDSGKAGERSTLGDSDRRQQEQRTPAIRLRVCLVEMGGVEPPSRAFSRGSPTGVVGAFLSLLGSHRQDPSQPSRITLDLARTGAWARGTPVLRRPLRTHRGEVRADVAALLTQPERVRACQLLCCPFLRVRGRPRPAIPAPTALSKPVIPSSRGCERNNKYSQPHAHRTRVPLCPETRRQPRRSSYLLHFTSSGTRKMLSQNTHPASHSVSRRGAFGTF